MRATTYLWCTLSLLHSILAINVIPSIPDHAFKRDPPVIPLLAKRSAANAINGKRQLQNTSIHSLYYAEQTYNVLLSVGSYNYELSLDTASSDAWVVSTSCSNPECNTLPAYPETHYSSTFAPVNDNSTLFGVAFQDGTSASGFIAKEAFTVGNFRIENQTFGLVSASNVTLAHDVSGVFGLGFPRLSSISSLVPDSNPFVIALVKAAKLAYPLFGLSLSDNTGTISLGAIDGSVVPNVTSVHWNTVAPFGEFYDRVNSSVFLQWAVELSNVTINGTGSPLVPTYPQFTGTSPLALIDVGVSGIYGPLQDVVNLYSKIPNSRLVGDGTWSVPCDSEYVMTFVIGGRNYTLQLTDLIYAQLEGNPNMCLTWPSSLQPSPDGIDWQLGTPFLRSVYTVFSYGIAGKEPPMIGFAPMRNNSAPAVSPDAVSSFLASESLVIQSTLPNVLLPTPTYSTPPYLFNASMTVPTRLASSGIGASTYSRLITKATITYLPTITPSPTLMVFTTTNESGLTVITTSSATMASVALGVPRASSASIIVHPQFITTFSGLFLLFWVLFEIR